MRGGVVNLVFDTAGFSAALKDKAEAFKDAARPAAQAGAQIIYVKAKLNASKLRSEKEHYFYGTTAKKAPKGQKKQYRYGPYQPGTLYESIYQVFSKDRSSPGVATYHISWNAKKAPYGAMVELGTSRAAAHAFIGPAVVGGRNDAQQAMKAEFIKRVEAA
jgi:HK97 gp10 family phage protein